MTALNPTPPLPRNECSSTTSSEFVYSREGATTDKDGLYHGQAGYKNHIKKNEAQVRGVIDSVKLALSAAVAASCGSPRPL